MTGETFDDEETSEPRTERVRIVGAARVGDLVEGDEPPAERPRHASPTAGEWWLEDPAPAADEHRAPAHAATTPEAAMPHWTEAPTGEVPAVLDRRPSEDDDPWASLPEPTWREASADWEQDEPFANSLLGTEGDALSPLGEEGAVGRQPWTFDLDEGEPATDELFSAWTRVAGTAAGRAAGDEETAVWDPDLVAGEQTTELRLPPTEEAAHAGPEPTGMAALEDLVVEERRGWLSRRRGDSGAPGADEVGEPQEGIAPGDAVEERRAGAVSERTGRNIPVAVASGLAIGAVALVAFSFGTVASMVVVTAVVTVAAMEAFAAFRKGGHHPVTLLGLIAVVALMVGTYTRGQQALPLVLVLLVAFSVLWHLAGVDRRAEPVRSISATLFVVTWIGVFGSFAALLLAPSMFPHRHGIAYLLGAVIAGVAYDVGALGVGAWLGRHPLSAASPGKTWEGAIGGAVVAIVVAVAVVHLIHPWTLGRAAGLGVVVAVVSPVGDLAESLVKRYLRLKDMGRLLPGHGGLLDRIDGLLFVLPATFYLLRAVHAG